MNEKIAITTVDDDTFGVEISGEGTTKHTVTLTDVYHEKLTNFSIHKDELVRRSIMFLLDREPKESILKSFDLSVIAQYFPEYESTISTH